jgi:hypothetical protein
VLLVIEAMLIATNAAVFACCDFASVVFVSSFHVVLMSLGALQRDLVFHQIEEG